jgi:hypothetical protein
LKKIYKNKQDAIRRKCDEGFEDRVVEALMNMKVNDERELVTEEEEFIQFNMTPIVSPLKVSTCRSLLDDRVSWIEAFLSQCITLSGKNTCKLCESDSTIETTVILEGDQQHKIHIVESLVDKDWIKNKSGHNGKHTAKAEYSRKMKNNSKEKNEQITCSNFNENSKGKNRERNFNLHINSKHLVDIKNLNREEGSLFCVDYFMTNFNVLLTKDEFDNILESKQKKITKK